MEDDMLAKIDSGVEDMLETMRIRRDQEPMAEEYPDDFPDYTREEEFV